MYVNRFERVLCASGGACGASVLGACGRRSGRLGVVGLSLRLLPGMVREAQEKPINGLDKDMKPSYKRLNRYKNETLIGIYMDADEKTRKARAKRYYRQLRKIWEERNNEMLQGL